MGRGRGGRRHSGPCSGRYPCDNCYTRIQRAINEDDSPTVGGVTEAIVSGAIAVAGAYGEPQQASDTTLTNWGESSENTRLSDRDRELRGGTRDKGYGSSGSSQSV